MDHDDGNDCYGTRAKQFRFRKRSGQLKLKSITSLDIDSLIYYGRIDQLQNLLDNVTFSQFKSDDVKSNTSETTAKVVEILQLLVEYLLHCQEKQCETIKDSSVKTSYLKKKNGQQETMISAMKEDTKIYQRQLATLRESLAKCQGLLLSNGLGSGDAIDWISNNGNDFGPAVLDSIIQHERETREYVSIAFKENNELLLSQFNKVNELKQVLLDEFKVARTNKDSLSMKLDSVDDAEENKEQSSLEQVQVEAAATPTIDMSPLVEEMKLKIILLEEDNNRLNSMIEMLESEKIANNEKDLLLQTVATTNNVLQTAANEVFSSELIDRERLLKEKETRIMYREEANHILKEEVTLVLAAKDAIIRDQSSLLSSKESVWLVERQTYEELVRSLREEREQVLQDLNESKSSSTELLAMMMEMRKVAGIKAMCNAFNKSLVERKRVQFNVWKGASMEMKYQMLTSDLNVANGRNNELVSSLHDEKVQLSILNDKYNRIFSTIVSDASKAQALFMKYDVMGRMSNIETNVAAKLNHLSKNDILNSLCTEIACRLNA